MTVPTTIDADAWLSKYLEGADGGASRSGSGGPLILVYDAEDITALNLAFWIAGKRRPWRLELKAAMRPR